MAMLLSQLDIAPGLARRNPMFVRHELDRLGHRSPGAQQPDSQIDPLRDLIAPGSASHATKILPQMSLLPQTPLTTLNIKSNVELEIVFCVGGVFSPLLANIVLNHLDWTLAAAGYRFARYADDFVIVCRTKQQAQEALNLVRRVLENDLGLALSKRKTRITTYEAGYEFLGFFLSSRSRRMRSSSVEKFKAKVRQLTIRKHNLDQRAIVRLNQVLRGTALYFATDFATCRWNFQKLDSWIRMRLRCMKLKRKNYNDNRKLRVAYFRRKLGLLTLEEFCTVRDLRGNARRVIPRHFGATSIGAAR